MSAETPVLLIAWRRPHTLRQVIQAIRPIAPRQLFVACDGARPDRPGEAEQVAATRAVVDQEIDWPCEVHRLYSDVNQGCSVGPIRAISWFFEHVEEGIILEDDCVPHPDFFSYCTTLLCRYRHDERVWCISGNNFQNGRWRGMASYYFSAYTHCWGWASWRRCWQHFDAALQDWPAFRDSGLMPSVFDDPVECRYWSRIWDFTHARSERVSWWDYQWTHACLIHGGLTVLPNRNLVRNVGFGEDATHTKKQHVDTTIAEGLAPLEHPRFVVRDRAADRYTFDHVFGGQKRRFPWVVLWLTKSMIVRLLRRLGRQPQSSWS